MAVPMNNRDYQRFSKLTELMAQEPDAHISIYTDGDYVSLEIRGKLTTQDQRNKLKEIFLD